MSALDLLLGTRHLRREIEAQALQLGHDIQKEQILRTQLRQTFVSRVTSPLGLLSAVAAGFAVGKIGGRPSHISRAAHAVMSIITLAAAAARSVAIQTVLPMAIEWIQSRFTKQNDEEYAVDTKTKSDSAL